MCLTQTLDPLNLLSVSDINGIKKHQKSVFRISVEFFFLMGDGLLKVQRMGTSPFHSPKVSAHKKLSAVV